jgi:hypothetical protein
MAPATVTKQDISFFNSIDIDRIDILQPVLEYLATAHR